MTERAGTVATFKIARARHPELMRLATYNCSLGELAEWSIAPVLKTGSPQGLQGSNPWLSAKHRTERPAMAGRLPLCLSNVRRVLSKWCVRWGV